jgi:hypothetical protein
MGLRPTKLDHGLSYHTSGFESASQPYRIVIKSRERRLTVDPSGIDILRAHPLQPLSLEPEPIPIVHLGIGNDSLDGRDIFRQVDVAVEFDLGTVELEGGDGGVGVTVTTLRRGWSAGYFYVRDFLGCTVERRGSENRTLTTSHRIRK